MSDVIAIDDPRDPRLAHYFDLKDHLLRGAERRGERGTFIAESEQVVLQLVASGLEILSVALTPTRLDAVRRVLPAGVTIYVVPEPVMPAVVGFNFHRGVMACGRRPPEPPLDRLLQEARTLVVLEHVSNQDNVGAVFRNLAGLAGTDSAVLLSADCCDPLYRKAIRVSCGHALRIPFRRAGDFWAELSEVRAAGFTVLALTPADDAVDIRRLPRPARPALLLGAEGPGLSERAQREADRRVRIPMRSQTDSLNVSVASAVALYALGEGEPAGLPG